MFLQSHTSSLAAFGDTIGTAAAATDDIGSIGNIGIANVDVAGASHSGSCRGSRIRNGTHTSFMHTSFDEVASGDTGMAGTAQAMNSLMESMLPTEVKPKPPVLPQMCKVW
jgi:hypothetical protein